MNDSVGKGGLRSNATSSTGTGAVIVQPYMVVFL